MDWPPPWPPEKMADELVAAADGHNVAALKRGQPMLLGRIAPMDFCLAGKTGMKPVDRRHRTVLVGMGERSSPQGIGQLAEALFAKAVMDRVLAFRIPKSRAAMHLDTVFTLCAGDVVTTFKEVADELACYDIRPGEGKAPLTFRHDPRPIFEIVAEVLGYKKLQIVPTGGNTEEERAREQWNDGNNVLALRPGVVIGYDRNDDTNAALKARRHRGAGNSRRGARPWPRRRPLHELPDHPRRNLISKE